MTISEDVLRAGISNTLDESDLSELGEKYEGKVRDNYTTKDGRRVIVVISPSARFSAGNEGVYRRRE